MTEKERKLALYCLKASSDYHSEVCEECINYPNCDHTIQDDVTETIIKALEQTDGDLISRDYVLSKFKEQCDICGEYKENNGVMCRCCALDDAIDCVEDAPSADNTAEWAKNGSYYQCSNCLEWAIENDENCQIRSKYCPNCGRRMLGEQTE